ncbi:unnamed protein product [Arabis nemorensis]|uniref:Uncharacterized protein n=1 Tax=Arabis nemorensis TaxID=586526 RepID=A0A565CQ12_9BRAS|nr:unnamed protein product [Arabis nemorensis]
MTIRLSSDGNSSGNSVNSSSGGAKRPMISLATIAKSTINDPSDKGNTFSSYQEDDSHPSKIWHFSREKPLRRFNCGVQKPISSDDGNSAVNSFNSGSGGAKQPKISSPTTGESTVKDPSDKGITSSSYHLFKKKKAPFTAEKPLHRFYSVDQNSTSYGDEN